MPSKLLVLIAAVGALIALPLSAGAARAEKRVALVIGNGVYQNAPKLTNPIKDAAALADMFKKAGFDWVKLREDVGNLEFKRALREFMDAAQDADIAVVYYAGHGIQVRDMNYMIPVDAKLATEVDADDEAVSLERIVMALEPAKRLRLLILDACRDNPFARTMKRRVAVRAIGGGLAMMEPMLSDTLIAYAAKAGSTAEDGGGENSPFAAALVKHLSVPGLDIRLAFGRVRDEVIKRSRNRQEPFIYGSLGGEAISLVPAPAPQAQADQARAEQEEKARAEREAAQQREEKARTEREATQQREEKARTEREATQQREEKARTEREATQQREEKARVSREAAQQREAETRRLRAEDASREAAEREAARKREDGARLAKLTEPERNPQDDTCSRDDEKLARLRASLALGWAREDLKRLQQNTACDRVRSDAAALLTELTAPRAEQYRDASEPPLANTAARKPQDESCSRDDEKLVRLRDSLALGWAQEDLKRLQQTTACDQVRSDAVALLNQLAAPEGGQYRLATAPPSANSSELVLSAQRELQRLGCFDGEEDGRLGAATTAAIRRYLTEKGRPGTDVKVTDTLIAELKDQSTRICPLTCARGERADGDRCVADAKPQKPTTARPRNEGRRAEPTPSTSRPGGKN